MLKLFQDLAAMQKILYIETSAKNPPVNVDKAFHEVVRIIRNQPQNMASGKHALTKAKASNNNQLAVPKPKRKRPKSKCAVM